MYNVVTDAVSGGQIKALISIFVARAVNHEN